MRERLVDREEGKILQNFGGVRLFEEEGEGGEESKGEEGEDEDNGEEGREKAKVVRVEEQRDGKVGDEVASSKNDPHSSSGGSSIPFVEFLIVGNWF